MYMIYNIKKIKSGDFMKKKLGWILFSIMTIAVVVLSCVLISHNMRWKAGDKLLEPLEVTAGVPIRTPDVTKGF